MNLSRFLLEHGNYRITSPSVFQAGRTPWEQLHELNPFFRYKPVLGYAVSNENFWNRWQSEKQNAIRRIGFQPRPHGELVGSEDKVFVSLPRKWNLNDI